MVNTSSTNQKVSGLYFLMSSSDRKSTRLNSSHSQISYAVFCLKKKKKITLVKIRSISQPRYRPTLGRLPLTHPSTRILNTPTQRCCDYHNHHLLTLHIFYTLVRDN